jgi:CTP synthase (UTP-ammonia lyase)
MRSVSIGLIGDFAPNIVAHRAIPKALELASQQISCRLEVNWLHTASLGKEPSAQLTVFAGLWCVPGSPYANTDGALAAIRFARESGRPFLGTCGGFQHALLEYARNVLGFREAGHAETQPEAEMLLIAPLDCALVERSGMVAFADNSQLRRIYGTGEAEEQYHCSYGLNPKYEKLLEGSGLRVSGRDESGQVRAVELGHHPFFLATLFQPERAALRLQAHPLVTAFVGSAVCQA